MSAKEQTHSDNKTSPKLQKPKPVANDLEPLVLEQAEFSHAIQRATLNPELLTPDDREKLQRMIGNQRVEQLLAQTEQQRPPLTPAIQLEELPEEEVLQAKSILRRPQAIEGGEASTNLESTINDAIGNGQPLDAGLQQSKRQTIGADISEVRAHTDAQSDQLNQSIQAKTFTAGQDLFFRQGAYELRSRGGPELIAQELTYGQGKFTPMQRHDLEEEELLQGKFTPMQRQGDIEEEELLQGKFATHNLPTQFETANAPDENRTGMPDQLKAGLEQLSNLDLSGTRVHYNSPKPMQLNALAYTQGQDIEVGPGQERHLPHEGWHVVQQMQGRVKPTMQAQGAAINDDQGLEHEADMMGAKAIQMHQADQEPRNGRRTDASDIPRGADDPVQMLRIYRRPSDGALIIELDVEELGTYIHAGQILKRYRVEGGLILYVDPGDNRILSAAFEPWTPRDLADALTQFSGNDDPPPDAPGGQVAAGDTTNIVFILKPLCICLVRGETATVRMISVSAADDAGPPQVPHILMPRPRGRVDAALKDARDALRAMAQVDYSRLYWLGTGVTRMQEIINRMVAPTADSVHPLPDLRQHIVQYVERVRNGDAKEILGDDANAKLLKVLEAALEAFDAYAQPKKEVAAPRGLIDREFLNRYNITVLELGGIGLNPGVLDLNIDDSTNNSNMMVVGDAMDLPSQFAANAVDRVTADLLPIVLMVGDNDTRTARRNAVARVLFGVNHVTGNAGTARIQFNDNSGAAALNEDDLKQIANTFGFQLRDDSPKTPYRRFIFER